MGHGHSRSDKRFLELVEDKTKIPRAIEAFSRKRTLYFCCSLLIAIVAVPAAVAGIGSMVALAIALSAMSLVCYQNFDSRIKLLLFLQRPPGEHH